MERKTEFFIADNLNKTKNKLRFINVGLTQNGCEWDNDDISGLCYILSDIEDTIEKMCEKIRQERKQADAELFEWTGETEDKMDEMIEDAE